MWSAVCVGSEDKITVKGKCVRSVLNSSGPFALARIATNSSSAIRSLNLKMFFSDYVKQRILFYRRSGKSLQQMVRNLTEEGHIATRYDQVSRRYYKTGMGMIVLTPGSGHKSKMTVEAKQITEEHLRHFHTRRRLPW